MEAMSAAGAVEEGGEELGELMAKLRQREPAIPSFKALLRNANANNMVCTHSSTHLPNFLLQMNGFRRKSAPCWTRKIGSK